MERPLIEFRNAAADSPTPLEFGPPPKPLYSSALITYTVFDSDGKVITDGLDQKTAWLFAGASDLFNSLRDCVEQQAKRTPEGEIKPIEKQPAYLQGAIRALNKASGADTQNPSTRLGA